MTLIRIFAVVACIAASPLMLAAAPDERYIVQYSEGADTTVRKAIENQGGRIMRALAKRHLFAAELPPGLARQLASRGDISLIEPDPKRYTQQVTPYGIGMVEAFDPDAVVPNGLKVDLVNAPKTKICIMDSGIDRGHEDLPASGFTGNDDCGAGCGSSGNWFEDGFGHGTHVAGTIAAMHNDVGVVGVESSGALPIHIVKVFNNQGNWAYGSDLIAALDQCAAAGAKIVNMSLGGSGSSVAEASAFTEAYIGEHPNAQGSMLFVAAAGNAGNESRSYPAAYDSVLSVAAIDSAKQKASFSQYNHQVELAAPGVAVNSTLPGDSYAAWGGTSMATPHVTGVAALVWSHYPDCTAEQIRTALVAGAEDLGGIGRDSSYGYGLVQALASEAALNASSCTVTPPANGGYIAATLINGAPAETIINAVKTEEFQYEIEVPPGASDLRIRLYDVEPGNAGGGGDADLHVLGPGESTSYPATDVWDCRPWINGSSEECVIDSPADGLWRIMLRAYLDFTNVTVQASFTIPGDVPDQYHFADADIASKGTVSGSFMAHEFNDGDMQMIREVTSGGNPSRRTSLLDHQWRIPNVTNGTEVTLHLVAAVSDSGEGDTISFTASYDGGGSWQPLCLSASSCDLVSGGALQYYPVALPASTSGTVLVRARDNDRSPQHLSTDILYVDQMYIVTTNADTEPPAPPPVEPPESLVLEASGEKRRKGQIFVILQWSPATTVTVEWSVDGATFNEVASEISGSGYEHNTGLKGSQTLYYRVCTAPGDCSNTATVAF